MKGTPRAGFHLLDCTRSLVLVSLLVGGFLVSLEHQAALAPEDLRAKLTADAERATRAIARTLARAGHVSIDPAPRSGGSSRALAYVVPRDADGDGWPDLRENGEVRWEETPRAFLHAPQADGRDALVLRTPTRDTVLARDVVALVFETRDHDATLPSDAVRVRITLRRTASDGTPQEVTTERVVRAPSGGRR